MIRLRYNQLQLDGGMKVRTRIKWKPGEYQALRANVKVYTCDCCESVFARTAGREYSWNRAGFILPYYSSPWTEYPDRELIACVSCFDRGDWYDWGNFTPEHCVFCERDICQRSELNGWREYFHYEHDAGEFECSRCYHERLLTDGIPPVDEWEGIPADFMDPSEILDAGFERVYENVFVEVESIKQLVRPLQTEGLVVLDLLRSGMGLEGYVDIYAKLCSN